MILTSLSDLSTYERLHPLFPQLFRYLRETDLQALPIGRTVLDGDRLFLNVDAGNYKSKEEQLMEIHRRYIDVQIPLSQGETMGWCPLNELHEPPIEAYSEQTDRAFFRNQSKRYVDVPIGWCTLFFPFDAHAPAIGQAGEPYRKIIAKVLLE